MNKNSLNNLISELAGSARVLKFEDDVPVVFLFDENHENPNGSIERSVQNARELINKANVVLIGVESMAGGRKWDKDLETYLQDDVPDKWDRYWIDFFRNNCTIFLDALNSDFKDLIIGVENFYAFDKIPELAIEGKDYDYLHAVRSRHFIKTLIEEYNSKGLSGNLILNCGLNHNSDIEKWIEEGVIGSITERPLSFVRVNTLS